MHPLVGQSPAEEFSGSDPFWHLHFCACAHQFCCVLSSRLFWPKQGVPFVLLALAGVLKVLCIPLGKEERMCVDSKPDSITCYLRKTLLLSGNLGYFQATWHWKDRKDRLQSGRCSSDGKEKMMTESPQDVTQQNLEAHSSWEVLRLIA